MQFSLTPDVISKLNGIFPGHYNMAMDSVERMQQGDQFSLEKAIAADAFERQKQPLELARLGLQNDTAAAQLPGLRATSAMQERKNSLEDAFSAESIKSLGQKYSAEELNRHIAGVSNQGSAFLAAASMMQQAPLGGIAMARETLTKAGMWRPEWDGANPQQLQKFFNQLGENLTTSGAKAQQALQQQQLRAQLQSQRDAQLAEYAMQRQLAAQQARADLQAKMELAKRAGQQSKQTYENIAAQATEQLIRLQADTSADHTAEIRRLTTLKTEADRLALNLKTQPGVAAGVDASGNVVVKDKRDTKPATIPPDVKVNWNAPN